VKIAYAAVKMRAELGDELRQARTARHLSLEAASGAAKISQGYLHKLEAGGVNNPSPRVLQRLSEVLEVPYRRLMELADYLMPADDSARAPQTQETTAMATQTQGNAPTNREVVRLLETVLSELAEIKRSQERLTEALERISRSGA
jgi:transcriptional regulator with XRE-family HTH domain